MNTDYVLQLIIEAQDKYSAELNNISSQLKDIQKTAKNTWDTANNVLSWIKRWIASLWLSALIVKATKSVISLADNLEKSSIAFETMLWSAEASKQMLEQLSEFARKTPFELTWIRQNAQQLIAMWVNANDIIPTLKSLWDVSAWLSVPLERLALNYGQVIAQWKLTWRELRDFTMAWVPLLDELSKMLWKTTTQIQDMISKWQISSNDVVQAFQNMTSEWWRFADLMDKQANTLSWQRSNFKDTLNSLGEEIGSSLLPTLKWYIEQIQTRLSENSEAIKTLISQLFDNITTTADSIITVLQDVWNTCLELFFWIKQDWSNSAITFWQIFMAVLQKVWQWIEAVWIMVKQLRNLMKTWTSNIWNWLWWIKSWYDAFANSFFVKWDSRDNSYWAFMKAFWTYWATELPDVSNTIKDIKEERIDFGAKVIQQEDALFTSFEKTKSYFSDIKKWANSLNLSGWWIGDLSEWWWSWWSSKASKEREQRLKEAQKEAEEIAKIQKKAEKDKYQAIEESAKHRLNNQQKLINDLNDEYETAFKDLQKNIDETQRHIDSLNQDIQNLTDSLANMKIDEQKSIAKEVVNARKELKALEDEYEWLKEVANSVSREDLQWVWWIWKYDVDLIKKYKDYQDELASMYNGMTAEEQAQLDKEIEYAERYDSLNGIEKIKEDYRIRKEEIQSELDEKVRSLDVEMATKRQYAKEQQKLQDERVARIDEEVKKRENVANLKKEFEKKYMEILEIDHTRQVQMTNQLVDQWNAVYRAKMRAMSWWSDWSRASWWPVYAWNSYLVGEAWPELFVPSTNWKIVNNADLWNATWWIEITVNMWWVVVSNDVEVNDMAERVSEKILRDIQLYKKGVR